MDFRLMYKEVRYQYKSSKLNYGNYVIIFGSFCKLENQKQVSRGTELKLKRELKTLFLSLIVFLY